MSFISMLKKGAKNIGKGVSNKAKQVYADKMEEKEFYRQEYNKEKRKQIAKYARENAKKRFERKKEYF